MFARLTISSFAVIHNHGLQSAQHFSDGLVLSVGVACQYCDTAGRIENCQIGEALVYANDHLHTLPDRERHLPTA
jgi:hypothetical protein